MKYSLEDIKFEQISPLEFENLCYDLLHKYNFSNITWRQGGGDKGRDIEGSYQFVNSIKNKDTKWFFECKHYNKSGVPPTELNSKIAWADSEKPDFLVFIISSYITSSAREWLDKIRHTKAYEIILIEGVELKNRIINFSDLIERYFSLNKYDKLFKDIKEYKQKFNIRPSFEFLKEVLHNINYERLDLNDIGFILTNFYQQYSVFLLRNDYYGDFDEEILHELFRHIKNNYKNNNITSFEEYRNNYSDLGGVGFLYELDWDDNIELKSEKYIFQIQDLHLNYNMSSDNWKIGIYLVIMFEDVAFEFFVVEDTEIRIIKNFNYHKVKELLIDVPEGKIKLFERYYKKFCI